MSWVLGRRLGQMVRLQKLVTKTIAHVQSMLVYHKDDHSPTLTKQFSASPDVSKNMLIQALSVFLGGH